MRDNNNTYIVPEKNYKTTRHHGGCLWRKHVMHKFNVLDLPGLVYVSHFDHFIHNFIRLFFISKVCSRKGGSKAVHKGEIHDGGF